MDKGVAIMIGLATPLACIVSAMLGASLERQFSAKHEQVREVPAECRLYLPWGLTLPPGTLVIKHNQRLEFEPMATKSTK